MLIYNVGGYEFEIECPAIWEPVSSLVCPAIGSFPAQTITYDPPAMYWEIKAWINALAYAEWTSEDYVSSGFRFLFAQDGDEVSHIVSPKIGNTTIMSTPFDPPISRLQAEAVAAGGLYLARNMGGWYEA